MKPFVILQLRPEDAASDGEYEAFLKHGGLAPGEVRRIRIEGGEVPEIDLDDYSGIIMGGGPSNVSDDPEKKSEAQQKFEAAMMSLMDKVAERDFPFLGACYGIGMLTSYLNGEVSKEKFSEEVGGITVTVTDEGKSDPLLEGLPQEFRAFVGHKEACQGVAEEAVLLATSDVCPVQMIRYKKNIYATQFHPELDAPGIAVRINVYKHAGYFPPEDAEDLIETCNKETITVPMAILKRFVDRYRQ